MEIIIGAILFLMLLLIGGTLLASKIRKKKGIIEKPEEIKEVPTDCCGAHEVCEFDELRTKVDVVYYEDEELDRYKGMDESEYNDEQIEEFRDVLYTLKENELPGWLKSIELREINLPIILQSEARQLIADAINNRKAS